MRMGTDVVHDTTHEVTWVCRGSLAASLGDRSVVLCSGSVTVIPRGLTHSSWTLDEEIEEFVLHLNARVANLEPAAFEVAVDDAIAPLLATLGANEHSRELLEAPANELFALLLRGGAATPVGIDERLQRVVVAIAAEPLAKYSLEGLAEIAHVSPFHFARMFRAELGESPMRYVRRHRVGLASQLLRTTAMSVSEVAQRTGFSSAGRLSEAFRREKGCSPSEFRADA